MDKTEALNMEHAIACIYDLADSFVKDTRRYLNVIGADLDTHSLIHEAVHPAQKEIDSFWEENPVDIHAVERRLYQAGAL